jgi:hypothetical protein
LCRFISSSASASVCSGVRVKGFTTIPLSNRFTLRTASACCSTVRLRWSTPIPPSCAMAIAMSASVTVSIAEDRKRDLQLDAARQQRCGVGLGRQDARLERLEQHVVEGQTSGMSLRGGSRPCAHLAVGAIRQGA